MLNIMMLWLLLLIPPFLVLSIWRYRSSWHVYKALGGIPDLRLLFALRHVGKDLPILLALVAIILALSDSYWGERLVREANSGLEVVFVMDISQSMLAQDAIDGSRLQQQKVLAQELLFSLGQPQVGVVIFKGRAFSALPLTKDKEMVAQLISWLDTSWLSQGGSNIAEALHEARQLFSVDSGAERIIVLFSDGEATAGNMRLELRNLFHENIRVYSVGLGSPEGTNVPDAMGSPRMNSRGELLSSALNVALLRNIASSSGGAYFQANQPRMLEELKRALKENESKNFRLVQKRRSLFNFFIFSAIILLIASQIVRSLPWKQLFGAQEYL